jgi:hypothetical protein
LTKEDLWDIEHSESSEVSAAKLEKEWNKVANKYIRVKITVNAWHPFKPVLLLRYLKKLNNSMLNGPHLAQSNQDDKVKFCYAPIR